MSEAKQSLARIFFEEKDETFIHKEILKKQFLDFVSDPLPKFSCRKFYPPASGG